MNYFSVTLSTTQLPNESHKKFKIRQSAITQLKQSLQSKRAIPSLLPLLLAACGGGGGSPAPSTPNAPPPAPTPDFTENPANTFTARDDNDRTLSEGSSASNLTVIGKGGNDTITTGSGADTIDGGSGNDTINAGDGNNSISGNSGDDTLTAGSGNDTLWGGLGVDTVTAGDGDDIIIIIGTTGANDYTDSAITNPAGSGIDLSSLLSLNDINSHSTSDIVSGDSIDGGDGSDTLIIYGTVDLSGITIQNLTTLQVNSTVTLTPEQLQQFTTVNGDGSSVINIVNDGSDTLRIDLSQIELTNISSLNISGDVEIAISSIEDLAGINRIGGSDRPTVVIVDNGSSNSSVNLSDIIDKTVSGISAIHVEATATVIVDDSLLIAHNAIFEMEGEGTIIIPTSQQGSSTLDNVILDDDITIVDENGTVLDPTLMDAKVVPDIDPGETELPVLTIDHVVGGESNEGEPVAAYLSARYFEDVSFTYNLSDGTSGTAVIPAGSTAVVFNIYWEENDLDEDDKVIEITASDVVNATWSGEAGSVTIQDDDAPPTLILETVTVSENDGNAEVSVYLSAASGKTVSVDYELPDGSTDTIEFAPGETSKTIDVALPVDDMIDEDDANLTITFSNRVNLILKDANGTHVNSVDLTLIVQDDDPAPTISIDDITANETDETDTFTVTLSAVSGKEITVDYTAPDGTTGTLTFAVGETTQTFATAWTDDGTDEDDEVVTATLSNPSNATISDHTGSLTITDDDDAPTISIDDITANEIDEIDTFTVTLSAVSGKEITVDYTAPDGTIGTLIFAAGETTQTFTTTWTDDHIIEVNEIVTATLSNPTNATITDEEGSLTVIDNEIDHISGVIINGWRSQDLSGFSVSAAGDINGDGVDDIIIGAGGGDRYGNDSAGESYVIFGSNNGFDPFLGLTNLFYLDGNNGFVMYGAISNGVSGFSVSAAGDINDDGIDDVIIGAPGTNVDGVGAAGASYVVFGSNTGFSASLNLSTLDGSNGFVINGIDSTDRSGSTVSSAGDINGDGIDDIIIGAREADINGESWVGESYVVFGSTDGFSASIDLSSLNGSNGFVINGIDSSDNSGASVSSAGDINGDGIDDIIIGAYGGDPNGVSRAGESYVVFGSSDGFDASLDLSSLDGSNGFVINGIDPSDNSGVSVSSAGDVNGDGIYDIIIGANFAGPNGDHMAGESYIVFGSSDGFDASLDLSSLDGSNGFVINGVDALDGSGGSVSSAGDINGDGIDDILIGAYGADPNGNSGAGESYIVFGSSDGFDASLDLSSLDGSNGFVINGSDIDDESGASVSAAGDVNGDGIDDILIGAYGADPNGSARAGESYIVYGQAGSWAASYDLSDLIQNQTASTSSQEWFFGTSSADVFDFDSSWGEDTVSSFEDGTDLLDLVDTGLIFNDLTIAQSGSDTLIEDGSGNSITLTGITSTDITVDDFIF